MNIRHAICLPLSDSKIYFPHMANPATVQFCVYNEFDKSSAIIG